MTSVNTSTTSLPQSFGNSTSDFGYGGFFPGVPLLVPLLVDILDVCLDLDPYGDNSSLFVSHCVQLAVSLPGIIGALLALRVCCLKPLRSSVSLQAGCLAAYDAILLAGVAVVSVLALCGVVEGVAVDVFRVVQRLAGWGVTYTVVDITAERCFSLSRPLQAHAICTTGFARKRATVILIAGICFNVPYALDTVFDYSYKAHFHSCVEEQPFTVFGLVYSLYMSIIVLHLLPYFAIVIVNILLVYSLCLLKRDSGAATGRGDNSGQDLCRLVLAISLWYTLCMLVPNLFFLIRLTDVGLLEPQVLLHMAVAADTLAVLDSALNFVFYFLFWRHFRQEFMKRMCDRCLPVMSESQSCSHVPSTESTSHQQ